MSEENKYYTPEVFEFHVNFEYQEKQQDGTWKDVKFPYDPGLSLDDIYGGGIRVKHLDREDIESLGFEFDKGSDYYWTRFFNGEYLLCTENEGKGITLEKDGDFYFMGKIKNKSELKRILKQIGV